MPTHTNPLDQILTVFHQLLRNWVGNRALSVIFTFLEYIMQLLLPSLFTCSHFRSGTFKISVACLQRSPKQAGFVVTCVRARTPLR